MDAVRYTSRVTECPVRCGDHWSTARPKQRASRPLPFLGRNRGGKETVNRAPKDLQELVNQETRATTGLVKNTNQGSAHVRIRAPAGQNPAK